MSLMKVGDLEISREDLIFDTVRKIGLESPVVHGWLTMRRSNQYWMGREEALIGMVITLNHQLKEANQRLIEATEC